jgi:hypothetical protein
LVTGSVFLIAQDLGYSTFMTGIGYSIIATQLIPTFVYIAWNWKTPNYYDVFNKKLEIDSQPKELEMGWFTPSQESVVIPSQQSIIVPSQKSIIGRTSNSELEVPLHTKGGQKLTNLPANS